MRIQLALATTTALALALSACGGASDTEDADTAAATAGEVVTDDAMTDAPEGETTDESEVTDTEDAAEAEAEAGEEAAEPAAAASAAPGPTPTAAAAVAAATPPQSFSTCTVCHSVEPGQNMIGPSLAGVFGRQAGSVAGATYSPAMRDANITWTEANLRNYIADPAAVVPGGTMPNPGVSVADAQAIVNYLKTL